MEKRGVAWAVNLYKGAGQAPLANGTFQGIVIMGVDDASQAGTLTDLVVGSLEDIQAPDAHASPRVRHVRCRW